jgi:hypothetical protein
MQHLDPPMPERPGGSWRGLFARRPDTEHAPGRNSYEQRMTESLRDVVDERLDDGLRAIEQRAADLMREVAAEMWRDSGGDIRPEQERIVSILSRDQALRSLITANDERFQALALRADRLEDTVLGMADSSRGTRRAMEASAKTIKEISTSPTLQGIDGIRNQLELVEHHIAETFAHLDERDRLLTESIDQQVKEHAEIVAAETARIVDAMEGYVQGGTEVVGRLAQRMEAHADAFEQAFAAGDGPAGIGQLVDDRVGQVEQQIEMLSERVGIRGRDQESLLVGIERHVEQRMMGLAGLIRSDSQNLKELIEERTSEQDEVVREQLDEAIGAHLEEIIDRTRTQVEALARTTQEQTAALTLGINASIERHFADLSQQMDDQVEAPVGQVATLPEDLEERLGDVLGDKLSTHVDDRVTAIARLIRSDNRVLAEQMAKLTASEERDEEDVDMMKHVLRSVKELQAGVASDLLGTMDQRFQTISHQLHQETQSTAEAMVKVAEVLGEKIDRLSVRVDQGRGEELQVVIERMSDAIRAMSAAGRERTIELE